MKTFFYTYDKLNPDNLLNEYGNVSDIVFIDIETTGLSPLNSSIYLIGAGYYDNNEYKIIQWFAETPMEEPLVLKAFFDFLESYRTLIHFNGDRFDIPFIEKRAEKHSIKSTLSSLNSVDIYKKIKPFKSVLGLQDLRQKTIELFLGIDRNDLYSGGELIPVYKKYTMKNDDNLLKLLLLHNEEDVLNMHKIIPMLHFSKLDMVEPIFNKYEINTYKTFDNEEKKELIITCTHKNTLPTSFKSNNNGIYVYFSNDGTLTIRLPIEEMELKLFYPDTNNYYYLPDEDTCIHKLVASAVDSSHREKAKKANCYTRHNGEFIPCKYSDVKHIFKRDYKSKDYYILLSELPNMSSDELNMICKAFLW